MHRRGARGSRRRPAQGRMTGSAGPRSNAPVWPSTARSHPTAATRFLCPGTRAGVRATPAGSRARHRGGRATRAPVAPAARDARARRARRTRPPDGRGARSRPGALPAARPQTRGSSRASSTGRRCVGGGSCRPASRSRRGRRRRSASAASSVQPPAKTARRAKRSCSAGVSRSWLQAIVARSVRCRSGADREPPASSGSRCSSRSSSTGSESAFTRAAASSIASGRQSRRRQISATSPFAAKSELTASGPLHEELDRLPLPQRIDGDLPLAVEVQRLAARDEHGQLRTRADRLGDAGGGVEQMLEVVEHEQQALVADRRPTACPWSPSA